MTPALAIAATKAGDRAKLKAKRLGNGALDYGTGQKSLSVAFWRGFK